MKKHFNWERLRKNLLLFDIALCLFLIFSNIILYYTHTRNSYEEMLQLSYDGAIAQVAKSYETLIGYAENAVTEAALQDGAVAAAAESADNGVLGRTAMIKALETTLLRSDFLSAVSLYLYDLDLVYTAGREHNSIVPLSAYADADLISQTQGAGDGLQRFAPRADATGERYILTVTVRLRAGKRQYGVLSGDIDLNEMSRYVLDRKLTLEGHNEIYMLDKDGAVIYPDGAMFAPDTERTLMAASDSDTLGWRFVLLAQQPRFRFLNRDTGVFLLASLLLLGIGVAGTLIAISRSMRPVRQMMEDYAHNFWNRVLTGDVQIDDEAIAEMRRQDFSLERSGFAVLAVENGAPAELPGTRVARMRNDLFAVICRSSDAVEEHCACILKESPEAWIGVSSRKNTAAALQTAFHEAVESLKYKLCAEDRVIRWVRVEQAEPFRYDRGLEVQLVNNVLAGNTAASLDCLESIFSSLRRAVVEDNRVFSVVYQLQNAILRGVSFLSIPFPAQGELPVEKLQAEMETFVRSVCEAVNSQNTADQYSTWEQVLFEIERNFTSSDFCLDYLSESLGMNKAYLSKCIKENTGVSFPEFINKKRVEIAKLLLLDTDESIETISGKLGFNYSYYFIRTFKRYEGITPKQFRDTRRK